MAINLYYHGGSANHGCEAIVRSTATILNTGVNLYSFRPWDDRYFGLDQVVTLKEDSPTSLVGMKRLLSAVGFKINKNDSLYIRFAHDHFFSQIMPGDVCLSIGGDNYCYSGTDVLGYYNHWLHKRGAKTVLWGCSVELKGLSTNVLHDLASYDLIVARERFTYDSLKKINTNTVLFPDPAFCLATETAQLPDAFSSNKTIGINVSPLIMKSESITGITVVNYKELLQHILETTDFNIALIPHVTESGNDDREVLDLLFSSFPNNNRLIKIGDATAPKLKYYISLCRAFIGARTHATIAAYSSCVPTLALGYSVKARGIATELFGTDEGYVLPVQSLKDRFALVSAYKWLMSHEDNIRKQLSYMMPSYQASCNQAATLIKEMVLS